MSVLYSPHYPRFYLQQFPFCGQLRSKNDNRKIPELHAVLSSVVKSRVVMLCPAQDMNHPCVQLTCPLVTQ